MPTITTADGVDIAWYDMGGDGPAVLLCHATGFHAHVWLPVVDHLRRAGFHCYAFDERGHGDSTSPADGNFAWETFAQDGLAVVDAARLERPYAVGHSAGGALLLLAEEHRPGTFGPMYLYEPVVRPDASHADPTRPPQGNGADLADGAARRRQVFGSRQEAYDNYASKPPLSELAPESLRAYVDHGFDDLPDGTVRLKCLGADEAAVYRMGLRHHAWEHLDSVECPVTIACGQTSVVFGPETMDVVAQRLPHGRLEVEADLGHFGPLEDPAAVAARIAALRSPGAATPGPATPGPATPGA